MTHDLAPAAPLTHPPATAWPARRHAELHDELHARPALPARAPCVVSYWVHWGMQAAWAEATLALACEATGTAAPPPDARHHVLQVDGLALKFERHGEFVSWQANRTLPAPADDGDATLREALMQATAAPALSPAFMAALAGDGSGEMIAAAHVVMWPADGEEAIARCRRLLATPAADDGDAAPVVGAWIGDGHRGAVLSNLQLQADGFTRFVVLDFGLAPDQAAREAQRLCEIEAYRMLAMLGFPVAQQEAAHLGELERELQHTVRAMANDESNDDAQAFEMLTRLAAAVENSTARTRYRFSATRAYHRIVERRLSDLREQRMAGVQTLGGFLGRRFAPAMSLCESTDARLTDIAERINRAVSLARVRVEMRREAGNQQVFQALAHRQKLQLRLQQTVEGLSVVAISYYALSLVGYLAKSAKSALPVSPDAVVGLAVLPVVAGVAWFVHRLRRHYDESP